jgi:putative ABC transport system ATP-binding protein
MKSDKDSVILSVKNLSYHVDGRTILEDISFEMCAGDRLAVFGPSGAGKSTLIRLINRLDEPTSGTVLVAGEDYRKIPPRDLRRRVGMVMQQPFLFPGTVAENLRFGPQAQGEDLPESAVEDLLSGVDLDGFGDRDVSKLSGGEAQRVNLARTLANEPEVLLLDEPTSSLDRVAKEEVEATLLSVIEQKHVACILVTHDEAQASRMTSRALILEKGKLIRQGAIEEVF